MKKFLLSLFAVLSFMTINAAEVTFDATTDKGTVTSQEAWTLTKDGVTLSCTSGINGNGTEYRMYANQTLTITSTTGNITSIVLTCTANGTTKYGPGCFTATPGDYKYETSGKIGTWTGDAASITFTSSGKQVRATKIVVTTGEATPETKVTTPTVTPAAGTYYSAISVTASTTTEGATLKYSTDGTNYADYTEPFTVNKDCTVYVYGVKDGLENSDTTEVAYKFAEPTPVANVAEALTKASDKTIVAFTNPVTVAYQDGYYTYAKDDTGWLLIYGSVESYSNGDVIPAGFYGQMTIYNGLYELSTSLGNNTFSTESFKAATSQTTAIEPTVKTLGSISATNQNEYVKFEGVTWSKTNKQLSDDEDALAVFYRFSDVSSNNAPADGKYDVEGFVSVYNSTVQLYPTKMTVNSGVADVEAAKAVVVAGDGTINVLGEANSIEVYTVGGALVSKNAASVEVAAGLYIVKVDGKATKVVVK